MNNLYSGIVVLAPDGERLSYMPEKRARWYVERGLAIRPDEKTIRLNFEPSGRSKISDWYLTEHKNRCVVCGEEDTAVLQKHHVVPLCLRTWMPKKITRHRSFDVLLVCRGCHEAYEIEASRLKDLLAIEVEMVRLNQTPEWRAVENRAGAVGTAWKIFKAPPNADADVLNSRKERILSALGQVPETKAQLEELDNEIQAARRKVADDWFRLLVEKHAPAEALIRRWRHHFVDQMRPNFLEPEWLADIEVVG